MKLHILTMNNDINYFIILLKNIILRNIKCYIFYEFYAMKKICRLILRYYITLRKTDRHKKNEKQH